MSGISYGLDTGLAGATPVGAEDQQPHVKIKAASVEQVVRHVDSNTILNRVNNLTASRAFKSVQDADETGVSLAAMERESDAISSLVTEERDRQYSEQLRTNPALARFAAKNPQYAAISKEELADLKGVQWWWQASKAGFQQTQNMRQAALLSRKKLHGNELTDDEKTMMARYNEAVAKSGDLGAESFLQKATIGLPKQLPNMIGGFQSGLPMALSSALGVAPTLLTPTAPLAPAAMLAAGTAGMSVGAGIAEGAIEGGLAYQEYSQMRDELGRPMDDGAARVGAFIVEGVNGGLGALGFERLLSTIPGIKGSAAKLAIKNALAVPTVRTALGNIAKKYAGVWSAEVAVEIAQEASTALLGAGIAEELSGQNFADDTAGRLSRIGEAGVAAAADFMFMPLAGSVAQILVDVSDIKKATKAKEKFIADWNDGLAKSTVKAGSSKAASDFSDEAAAEFGDGNVYISAKGFTTYWQSQGVDPAQAATEIFGNAEAYTEAASTDGRMVVPAGKYATEFAGTEMAEAIAKDIAFHHDELTVNELNDLVELGGKQEAAQAVESEYDQLYTNLRGQFEAIGYSSQMADMSAAAMASGYQATASRMDIGVSDVLKRFNPIIRRQIPGMDVEVGKERPVESGEGEAEQTPLVGNTIEISGIKFPVDEAGEVTLYEHATPEAPSGSISAEPTGGEGVTVTPIKVRPERIRVAAETGAIEVLPASEVVETTFDQQSADKGKRAKTEFTPTSAIITMLEKADKDSVIHETGHLFLEMLRWASEQPNAPQQVKDDLATLVEWFGVKDASEIGTKEHEQFADGVTTFFREGIAPSERLAEVFAVFGAWLRRLLGMAAINGVRLNPEVRAVMGRMLAAESEVNAASQEVGFEMVMADLRRAGFAEADLAAMSNLIEKKHREAVADLTQSTLRDMEKDQTEWWNAQRAVVEQRVRAEVMGSKQYVALYALTRGVMPDGAALKAPWVKLSRDELIEVYGDKSPELAALKSIGAYAGKPRKGVAPKWGVASHHVAAKMFGYRTGDELVQAIIGARPMEDVIQEAVEAKMRQTFPDSRLDGTLAIEARRAVLGDRTLDILEAIHKAVLQKLNDPLLKSREAATTKGLRTATTRIVSARRMRQIARAIIARKRVSELRPDMYRVQSIGHRNKAMKALRERNWHTAAAEFETEMLSVALYVEAQAAKKETANIVSSWQKAMRKSAIERLGKAGAEYVDQIRLILHGVGLIRLTAKQLKDIESLNSWLEGMGDRANDVEGFELPPELSPYIQAVGGTVTPYQQMTVEQIRIVNDDITQLLALAALKNRLLTDKKAKEFESLMGDIIASIDANSGGAREVIIEHNTPSRRRMAALKGFIADNRALASWAYSMDGSKDTGILWKYLIAPMMRANSAQVQMNIKFNHKYEKLLKLYSATEWPKNYIATNVPGTRLSLSKNARLVIALNSGNTHNLRVMKESGLHAEYGAISDQEHAAILDSLDERDWKFVTGVWALNEELFALTETHERRVRGVAPKRQELTPIVTKYGTFAGGYVPIKTDHLKGKTTMPTQEDMGKAMRTGSFVRRSPKDSFVKNRSKGAKHTPLRLDLGIVSEHIAEVIHYLSWQEFLIDAYRLVGDQRFRNAVVRGYGEQAYSSMTTSLKNLSSGQLHQLTGLNRAVDRVASKSTIALIGANLMTVLMQPVGITNSMHRVGTRWVRDAITEFGSEPLAMAEKARWIKSQSVMMEGRSHTQNVETNKAYNKIAHASRFSPAQHVIDESAFYLMIQAQLLVDNVTWLAAYNKGIALKKDGGMEITDHDDLIAYADLMVVRSQGSGALADLPPMFQERGAVRLFTILQTFFNITWQNVAESAHKLKIEGASNIAGFSMSMVLLLFLPVALTALMKATARGELGDDDLDEPNEIAARYIADTISFALGLLPVLRELSGPISGFGYEGPAGIRPLAMIGDLAQQLVQGEADESLARSAVQVGGLATGIPSTALWRAYQGAEDALDRDDDHNPLLVGGFGKAPEQKGLLERKLAEAME